MSGEPDLIVVGGGSAGLACAARLAEGGFKVLLVEAGKGHKDPRLAVPALMSALVHKPDFDWCYRAEPDLIVVGGGSAGLACAVRLAEGGLRVVLVEAGKSHRDPRLAIPALMSGVVQKPEFDWCYTAEPPPTTIKSGSWLNSV